MFIIPIGRDAPVHKTPYITVFFIAVNIVVFLITAPFISRQKRQIMTLEQELIETSSALVAVENLNRPFDFAVDVIDDIAKQVDENKYKRHFLGSLKPGEELQEKILKRRQRFKDGEIVAKDSLVYAQWYALYEKLEEVQDKLYKYNKSFLFNKFGFIPANSSFSGMFTSMFMHAGILHIIGNMWFLWLVGCSIEDRWGKGFFAIFYIISGIAALLMHKFMYPSSVVPVIGASGAVAGVMGAFMIRHYKTKIKLFYFVLVFIRPFWGTFKVFASVFLFFWFALQLLWGLGTIGLTAQVAFWAHIGGFAFGAVTGSLLKFGKLEERYIKPSIDKQDKQILGHPKMIRARELWDSHQPGNDGEALTLLKEVAEEEPNNIDAHIGLSKIYKHNRSMDELLYEYNRIIEIHIKRTQIVQALLIYSELQELISGVILEPKNQYYIARFMKDNGDIERALHAYHDFISTYRSDPLSWRVLFDCGEIYLENLKQPQEALVYYKKAMADTPPFEWVQIIQDKIRKVGDI